MAEGQEQDDDGKIANFQLGGPAWRGGSADGAGLRSGGVELLKGHAEIPSDRLGESGVADVRLLGRSGRGRRDRRSRTLFRRSRGLAVAFRWCGGNCGRPRGAVCGQRNGRHGAGKRNRQGRGDVLAPEAAQAALDLMRRDAAQAFDSYEHLLNADSDGAARDPERPGLARELARIGLPLSTYTQWYWKTDLHNLFHFISLRADPHAQYEIRVYADVLRDVVERWTPLAARAFEDYRLFGAELSRQALDVVRRRLKGETVDQASSGLAAREWRELEALLAGGDSA